MRGKVLNSEVGLCRYGITPAYAGKSSIVSPSSAVDWDHPRLCGEKQGDVACWKMDTGSPPPMRGKDFCSTDFPAIIRITPAYAGKSRAFIKQIQNVWDHPRLCGEKPLSTGHPALHTGSPPPMRGKVQLTMLALCAIRITPAYAGKRILVIMYKKRYKDHPRLCGEKFHILHL